MECSDAVAGLSSRHADAHAIAIRPVYIFLLVQVVQLYIEELLIGARAKLLVWALTISP